MPNKLHPLPKFIQYLLLATLVLLFNGVSANCKISAEEFESKLKIAVELKDKEASVVQQLTVKNNTDKDIVTSFTLPDVFKLTNLRANSQNVRLERSKGQIVLNFANSPILPGESKNITLTGKSANYTASKQIRSFAHEAIAGDSVGLTFKQLDYSVSYPNSWGEPGINIKSEHYTTKTSASNASYNFNFIPRLKLNWGDSVTYDIDYSYPQSQDTNDSYKLISIPRNSLTQQVSFASNSSNKRIFSDLDGNLFFAEVGTSIGTEQENSVKLKVALNAKQSATNSSLKQIGGLHRTAYSVPYSLAHIDFSNKQSHEQKIAEITSQINKIYKVEPKLTYRTTLPAEGSISELEYFLLVNQILFNQKLANRVVAIYQPQVDAYEFALELCFDGVLCEYYSLETGFREYEKLQISSVGIQLFAFDGLNVPILDRVGKIDSYIKKIKQLPAGSLESVKLDSNSENIDVEIALPDELKSFALFSGQVTINNNTANPVFPFELVIDRNSFNIGEQSINGIYEGVLPGESKSFTVDNLYFAKLFFTKEATSNVQIELHYLSSLNVQSKNLTKTIDIKQNYSFLGLLGVGIVALILTIYLGIEIYRKNKYTIVGAYWQTRRKVSDFIWHLQKPRKKQSHGL